MRRFSAAFRAFWVTLRGRRPAPKELREFVYLDETSVESLLASLDGEVLVGLTSSRSRSGEFSLSATGQSMGLPTPAAASMRLGRAASIQEERKSVAQSAFARLRERQLPQMLVRADRPISRDGVAESALRRGELVEVALELEGAEVFQVQAVITSMVEVVESYPEMLPESQLKAILDGAPIAKLLANLSRGLIPIEGAAVGISAVEVGGELRLVPTDAANQIAREEGGNVLAVRFAGVTQEALYWQDVRRVLFSRSNFRILARLLHDGVRPTWSSVKISEIVAGISSDLSRTLDGLGHVFLDTMRQGDSSAELSAASKERLLEAVMGFGDSLADDLTGKSMQPDLRRGVASLADQLLLGASPSNEWWKGVLDATSGLVSTHLAKSTLPSRLAELREKHSIEGFLSDEASTGASPRAQVAVIEVEVVAIYW